jgi:hypothetical protein
MRNSPYTRSAQVTNFAADRRQQEKKKQKQTTIACEKWLVARDRAVQNHALCNQFTIPPQGTVLERSRHFRHRPAHTMTHVNTTPFLFNNLPNKPSSSPIMLSIPLRSAAYKPCIEGCSPMLLPSGPMSVLLWWMIANMSLTSSASNQARKFISSHCGAEEGCCGDEEMGVSGVAVEEGASSSVEGRESVERASGSRLRFGVEGIWDVG